MRVQSLGFRTDLALRRLGGSSIVSRDGYIVVQSPRNPDFWWGNFVLLPEPIGPGHGERLHQIFREEFPDAAHLAIGIDGTHGVVGDSAEVESLGLTVHVDAVLTAERLRRPPRAAGDAVFRRLEDDDDWDQAVSLRLAVYDDLNLPDQRRFTERRLQESQEICVRGAGAWFGAFLEGRLVSALGLVRADAGLARYQAVETVAEHRGKGLASRLLYESSVYGNEVFGARTLVIAADPDYHAVDIYRSLGFAVAERQVQLELPRRDVPAQS